MEKVTISKRTYDRLKREAAAWRVHHPQAESGYVCEFCGQSEHKPNEETRAALRELERGGGKSFDTVDALMEDALGKDWRKYARQRA